MKIYWKEMIISFLACFVVPVLLINLLLKPADDLKEDAARDPVDEFSVRLLMEDGSISILSMNEYLTGVLLAEMPMDFHMEALKAQAVAARTFALKQNKHDGADVCGQANCCQAYISVKEYTNAMGREENVAKAQKAVTDTAGKVITYQNDLIDAAYFSCSGGRTEDALAVWGSDVPYLQAVDSPGEESAVYYTYTVNISKEEFCQRLGLDSSQRVAIENIHYTDGGSVDSIVINGVLLTGMQMRSKLGLRSTAFSITAIGDSVTITTRGYGHRVGMSQYGANAMAAAGCDYAAILTHYYTGTEVCDYVGTEN